MSEDSRGRGAGLVGLEASQKPGAAAFFQSPCILAAVVLHRFRNVI